MHFCALFVLFYTIFALFCTVFGLLLCCFCAKNDEFVESKPTINKPRAMSPEMKRVQVVQIERTGGAQVRTLERSINRRHVLLIR